MGRPNRVNRKTIHLLASHPTPPIFDHAEDRNGCRNHDEIRFWADYVKPDRSRYIYDDNRKRGGLPAGAHFVIAGDLNADPDDGASRNGAISQLLDNASIADVFPRSAGGVEQAHVQRGENSNHVGDPGLDTADFSDGDPGNLRLDYVLPATTLTAVDAGVYWPRSDEDGADLATASDHRLVWVESEPP